MSRQHPTHPRDRRQHPTAIRRSSHSTNSTNWSFGMVTAGRSALAALADLARAAGRRWVAAATGEVGRRLARAVGLTLALAVVVAVLYDQGEVPRAAAQPAVAAPGASGASRGPALRAGGHRDPGEHGRLRGRSRPARAGQRPAAVAAAWYAARNGLPPARVKALQQDRLSAGEVRVLVLADHGHKRLRTALVRVRRGLDGWRVR